MMSSRETGRLPHRIHVISAQSRSGYVLLHSPALQSPILVEPPSGPDRSEPTQRAHDDDPADDDPSQTRLEPSSSLPVFLNPVRILLLTQLESRHVDRLVHLFLDEVIGIPQMDMGGKRYLIPRPPSASHPRPIRDQRLIPSEKQRRRSRTSRNRMIRRHKRRDPGEEKDVDPKRDHRQQEPSTYRQPARRFRRSRHRGGLDRPRV